MIKQVQTKQTSIIGVMRSAPFVKGFKEARAGKPMQYDIYEWETNNRWDYERGRLFGLIFDGPLKVGKAVNRGAALHFAMAMDRKEIL